MTYNVIVRPEPEREIQEAFDWYEEREGACLLIRVGSFMGRAAFAAGM
jgi:hypothetical protein